ncbi:MAG TPA: aspartate aminotransferase family protein [Longimicrobium sp.]
MSPSDRIDGLFPRVSAPMPGALSTSYGEKLGSLESVSISGIGKGFAPIVLASGSGPMLADLDGNVYLDLTSSFGVATTGYCHPDVAHAVSNQAAMLNHTMASIFPHNRYFELLSLLLAKTGRSPDTQVVLTTSGSEAVEVALKLSNCYSGKPGVIAFSGSFHGQTLGSLSVTSINEFRDRFSPLIGGNVVFLPYPSAYRPSWGADASNVVEACLSAIETVLRHDRVGGPEIGCILVEPMLNAGGYVLPPPAFLPELRRLATQYNALLIADEIFTGFGRTGHWLLSDATNTAPDIICVGKSMTGGMPLAACLATREVMDAMRSPGLVPLHGTTYMANPICCAAAIANITILDRDGLIDRAQQLGGRIQTALSELPGVCDRIGDVRGTGAAWAIEFVTDRVTKEPDPAFAATVANRLLQSGILTLRTGLPFGHVLAICPPLITTDEQLDFALDTLRSAVEQPLS